MTMPDNGPLKTALPADQAVARSLIAMHGHDKALRQCVAFKLVETGKYILLDMARKQTGAEEHWPVERTEKIDEIYQELLADSGLL